MIKLHPERSKPVLLYVFESALRMLHPFMPFLTEELWQTMPHDGESIVIARYPAFDSALADAAAESQIEMIQDVIVKVRNIRSEMNVDTRRAVVVRMATEDPNVANLLNGARDYIFRLATVSQVEIVPRLQGDKLAAQAVAAGCTLEVPLEGLVDRDAEKSRLTVEYLSHSFNFFRLARAECDSQVIGRFGRCILCRGCRDSDGRQAQCRRQAPYPHKSPNPLIAR